MTEDIKAILEKEKGVLMNNLENWKEVTKGIYRYVIAANVCYEIHILMWNHKTDILSAKAHLFISGEWLDGDATYFERELLFVGPVASCLGAAIENNKQNNN